MRFQGCLMFEMLMGSPPFKASDELDRTVKQVCCRLAFFLAHHFSACAVVLLRAMPLSFVAVLLQISEVDPFEGLDAAHRARMSASCFDLLSILLEKDPSRRATWCVATRRAHVLRRVTIVLVFNARFMQGGSVCAPLLGWRPRAVAV